MSPGRMGYTPCWLRTSSSMRSRFISSKYVDVAYTGSSWTHCQFSQKSHQGWKEVLITSTPDPAAKTILRHSDDRPSHGQLLSTSQTRFRPVLATEPSPVSTLLGSSSPRFSSLPIGTRIEVSAASFRIARKLGTLISQGAGGCALIVDYGADHAVGNSFRVRVFSQMLLQFSHRADLARVIGL